MMSDQDNHRQPHAQQDPIGRTFRAQGNNLQKDCQIFRELKYADRMVICGEMVTG